MILSTHESVFSIPLRARWSADFSDELKSCESLGTVRIGGLDRFVADETNLDLRIFAPEKAQSIPLQQLDHFWPLTFYGASGTGKTSLALTVLAEISSSDQDPVLDHEPLKVSAKKPGKTIAMTGADFDRRFRSSFGTDVSQELRKKIVRSAGLLIDGVQQLEHKSAAQQELVQIIDKMCADQRPVIFTTERAPQHYEGLIPPLVSRLSGGLLLPVKEPGLLARSVIIRELGLVRELPLSDASVSFLAEQLNTSVPKIVHFFGQLKTAVQLERKATKETEPGKLIEPAFIHSLFRRSPEDEERGIKAVIHAVAAEFKVKMKDLSSDSRKQTIVFARGVAVYLLRRHLALSFLRIGSLFGNRDHSTIMHAYRKIETLVASSGDQKLLPPHQVADKNRIIGLEQSLANRLASEFRCPS